MRTNQFHGKKATTRLSFLMLLCLFIVIVQVGCKKDNLVTTTNEQGIPTPSAMLVPDEDETVYSMANYEDALNDVDYDGDRLIFKNLSHFVTTAMALDSLGDSTSLVWFQAIGFNASLYNEFDQTLENAPDEADEADLKAYFADHTNSVRYDFDNETWDVNAISGTFAKLLNSEHKAVIGGNVFYSNYDVNVTVSIADEGQISSYSTQGFEQNDENAIVQNNKSSGSLPPGGSGGDCWPVGFDLFMSDISCGSPASKKSEVRMKIWQVTGANSQIYTGATITVKHKKRGLFGFWFPQSRGSQVGGVFEGVYFNQAKIYANEAKVHEYEVCKFPVNLSSICWHDIQVCVAPMCNGETICQNW